MPVFVSSSSAWSRLLVLLCALLITASGCGADLSDADSTAGGVLVLRDTDPQRISGTSERGGALLRFSATRAGTSTHVLVEAADGTQLARSDGDAQGERTPWRGDGVAPCCREHLQGALS